MKDGVARLRAQMAARRVIGATLTSALGTTSAAHGFAEQDSNGKALNDFIRTSGMFDGVIDFDKVTLDPRSGGSSRSSSPTAPPAETATSSTRTAWAISRWARRSISICSSRTARTAARRCGNSGVGWVERSDTHQLRLAKVMGFAALHPSYGQFILSLSRPRSALYLPRL